jgi:hypothetical protein
MLLARRAACPVSIETVHSNHAVGLRMSDHERWCSSGWETRPERWVGLGNGVVGTAVVGNIDWSMKSGGRRVLTKQSLLIVARRYHVTTSWSIRTSGHLVVSTSSTPRRMRHPSRRFRVLRGRTEADHCLRNSIRTLSLYNPIRTLFGRLRLGP